MKREEIHFGDLRRWLIGYTTPEFMLEVALRTALIYLVLLFVVRLMGKRMTSQLTITELSVMITLGAIVSPAMQLPDRGLMFGVVGLFIAAAFQRGINLWAFKNPRVEQITQGNNVLIVKDGILLLEELRRQSITRQEIFARLREKNVQNLGKVKRLYLEACGTFTLYEDQENKPGLSVFPPGDRVVYDFQADTPDKLLACSTCGNVQTSIAPKNICLNCGSSDFIHASTAKS